MKTKFIQKMMAGALTVALVMSPSICVLAAGTSDAVSGGSSSAVTVEEEVVDLIQSSIAEVPTTSTVSGTKSTVQGVYLASSVNGTAVTSSLEGIADGYGLEAGEVPCARFSNMDTKKSFLAKASIDETAASIGATVGSCINIELGKKSDGKFTLLSQDGDKIAIKVGIPKDFRQADAEFVMICVRKGGVISVLEDIDSDPDTVTFETTGGQGAYAIAKY